MLDVFAPVVSDHHFVGNHKRLHEALAAHRAPLPVGAAWVLAVVLGHRGRLDRRSRADRAGCAVFSEVCEQRVVLSASSSSTEDAHVLNLPLWSLTAQVSALWPRCSGKKAIRWYKLRHASFLAMTDFAVPWPKYLNIHLVLFSNSSHLSRHNLVELFEF